MDQQPQPHQPQGKREVDRPSFTTFWKRGKDAHGQRRITFVSGMGAGSGSGGGSRSGSRGGNGSGSGGGMGTGVGDGDGKGDGSGATGGSAVEPALDKAQLRRAQVRNAQKQHRQRKADYIKELEIDVARIRDLIAQAQQETHLLRLENDAMKAQIQQPLAFPAKPTLLTSTPVDIPLPALNNIPPTSYSLGLEDITLSLHFDDVLNAPTFHINSSPSSSHYESSNRSFSFPDTTTTTTTPSIPDITPHQTQEAINFILALESICRNHFHPSPGKIPGHTLMASSLALRTAPPAVFTAADKTAPLLRSAKPSDLPKQGDCEWQAAGLTLNSLHGLACSIADAEVEITPVQAWFELAGRYKLEVLLRGDVLDGLKRELSGLVRCPHFGAVMERGAFESVVGRVMGGLEGVGLGMGMGT